MSDKKPTRSILQELEDYIPPTTYPMRLRTHGERVFSGIKKLMIDIEKNCEKEMADDLKKRFFNAARTNDFKKFERGVNKLQDELRAKKEDE